MVASRPRDLAEGRWQPVIPDADAAGRGREMRRVILCSGKVYVDLVSSELRAQHPEIAICRMEQLYPFPWSDLKPVLEGFPDLEEIVWVQEEPENMGAWGFVRPLIEELVDGRWPLRYVGRARSASPSEGSMAWHSGQPADAHRRSVRPADAQADAHGPVEEGVECSSPRCRGSCSQ